MDVLVKGKKVRLDPKKAIGKGGEADVFDIGAGLALKLFKSPTHPDFDGSPVEQEAARRRLDMHQTKLKAFPADLPDRVVKPVELAFDTSGRIVGYAMPFLPSTNLLRRYAEKKFRDAGVPQSVIPPILRDLHATVAGVHAKNVVIGDFNDLNVLVTGNEAHLIDADSMQFCGFLSSVFTARFVDPLKCDPHASSLMLVQPHDAGSDWYAYAVMVFQSLCLVDPYGGVYVPSDLKKKVQHDARPLHRITVMQSDVRYPKPAIPFGRLPDDLLQRFHLIFEKDERGVFPLSLIEALRWTTCSTCGLEHARSVCPTCATAAPIAVKEKVVVRGTVIATSLFRTPGTIVASTLENGQLKWLYCESGQFKREDKTTVLHGALDPSMRYRIYGDSTLLGKGSVLVTLRPQQPPETQVIDTFGTTSVFDTNSTHIYWPEQGRLMRSGELGSEYIGSVLEGQTLVWVGEKFGFGLSRAGALQQAFVFDATHHGINDSLKLARIPGQLLDATAVFGSDRCWFFVSYETNGKTMHRCTLIRANGQIEASAEVPAGDNSWLGSGIRGATAAAHFLLMPTDEGLVRVEAAQSTLQVTKSFPDTEPFVDAGVKLLAAQGGLYVVKRGEILKLVIK